MQVEDAKALMRLFEKESEAARVEVQTPLLLAFVPLLVRFCAFAYAYVCLCVSVLYLFECLFECLCLSCSCVCVCARLAACIVVC